MKYKLYCFAESGNCYKVALMLNMCHADWEPVFVDFFNGGHMEPEFLEINAMGEVPVLVAGDLKLAQSGVILDYLAEEFDQFDSTNIPEHREILRWLFFDNHKLTGNVSALRWKLQFERTGETEITKFLRARSLSAMKVLERHLVDREFVVGAQPTIADFSLCSYLFYGVELGFDLNEFPEVMAWLDRISEIDGWVAPYELMPGSGEGEAK